MIVSELYKKLNKGDISRFTFLEQVRKDPQMKALGINNMMSFDSIVKKLKGKRIISESIEIEDDVYDYDEGPKDTVDGVISELEKRYGVPSSIEVREYLAGTNLDEDEQYDVELYFIDARSKDPDDRYLEEEFEDDNEENTARMARIPDSARPDITSYVGKVVNAFKRKYDLDETLIDHLINKYPKLIKMGMNSGDSPEYTAENIMTMDEIDVPELNETNNLFEGKISMTIDKANPGEFRIGLNIEMEKGKDCDAAVKVVLKNLEKDPLFYTNEIAGFDIKKRTDLMVPVDKKGTNTIDKLNAIKVVEKNPKGDNSKETNEEVKPVAGVKTDTQTPKASKGVKKMEIPKNKEQVLKEGLRLVIRKILKEELSSFDSDSNKEDHKQTLLKSIKSDMIRIKTLSDGPEKEALKRQIKTTFLELRDNYGVRDFGHLDTLLKNA